MNYIILLRRDESLHLSCRKPKHYQNQWTSVFPASPVLAILTFSTTSSCSSWSPPLHLLVHLAAKESSSFPHFFFLFLLLLLLLLLFSPSLSFSLLLSGYVNWKEPKPYCGERPTAKTGPEEACQVRGFPIIQMGARQENLAFDSYSIWMA